MKAKNFIIPFFVCSMLSFFTGLSQTSSRDKNYNLEHGLAIEGYDPVSYFEGKPEKGKASIPYTYQGVTYRLFKCCKSCSI